MSCIWEILNRLDAKGRKAYIYALQDLVRDIEARAKLCKEAKKHTFITLNLWRGIRYKCEICNIAVQDPELADKRLQE